jgi:hypothetical protein
MEAFRNFRKAIHTIVDRLWEEKELRVNQVVLVTDSTEKDLLDGAEALGWHYINHPELGTSEQFGDWAPAILDSAILSRGIEFVGAFFPCPFLSFTANKSENRLHKFDILVYSKKTSGIMARWIDHNDLSDVRSLFKVCCISCSNCSSSKLEGCNFLLLRIDRVTLVE